MSDQEGRYRSKECLDDHCPKNNFSVEWRKRFIKLRMRLEKSKDDSILGKIKWNGRQNGRER